MLNRMTIKQYLNPKLAGEIPFSMVTHPFFQPRAASDQDRPKQDGQLTEYTLNTNRKHKEKRW